MSLLPLPPPTGPTGGPAFAEQDALDLSAGLHLRVEIHLSERFQMATSDKKTPRIAIQIFRNLIFELMEIASNYDIPMKT